MMNKARMGKWLAWVVFSLLLLALVFQAARLFWHIVTPAATVDFSANAHAQKSAPILSAIHFQASEAKGNGDVNGEVSSTLSNWQLSGIYAEGSDSVALLKTPEKRVVLGLNEHIGDYQVVAISADKVVLKHRQTQVKQTLFLTEKTINALLANTIDSDYVPEVNALKTTASTHVNIQHPRWDFSDIDWQPLTIDSASAVKLQAKTPSARQVLAQFGLQSGDILLSINQQPPTLAQLNQLRLNAHSAAKGNEKIRVKIKRNGKIKSLTIKR